MQRERRSIPGRRAAAALCVVAGAGLGASCSTTGAQAHGTVVANSERPRAPGHERSRFPTCRGDQMENIWAAAPGVCVTQFAEDLDVPRHLAFAPNGDLFVATRRGLVILWDADGNGQAERRERATIGAPDLSNQGIAFSPDGAFLYYAGDRAVRRIPYTAGMRAFEGPGETVIPDMPATISHPHKSITFDREGRLYVAVGSVDNLTPGRGARIMRYTVPAQLPAGGLAYESGEHFADGMRNAEALAWDHEGRLWALSNGRDDLRPPGTAANFYLDHPGDWVYRMSDRPGTFYGYPHCWLLGPVPWDERRDPLSQWPDPEAADGHDAAWCQNPANVWPAAGALPAHTAPLGAVEYTGNLFPAEYRHNLFVTSHGSWNRTGAQIGRTILRLVVEGDRVARVEPFVGTRGRGGNLAEGEWHERPVGIAQGPDGALYVTSDQYGRVIRVGYERE